MSANDVHNTNAVCPLCRQPIPPPSTQTTIPSRENTSIDGPVFILESFKGKREEHTPESRPTSTTTTVPPPSQPVTRKELKSEAQKILNFYGSQLKGDHHGIYLEGEDYAVIYKILLKHREYQNKIGVGIKHLFVAYSLPFRCPCFHIQRTNGSIVDFSYASCLSKSRRSKNPYDASRNTPVHFINGDHTGLVCRVCKCIDPAKNNEVNYVCESCRINGYDDSMDE